MEDVAAIPTGRDRTPVGEVRGAGSAPSKPPSYPVTAWPGSGVAAKVKLKPLLLGPDGLAVTAGASIAAAGRDSHRGPDGKSQQAQRKTAGPTGKSCHRARTTDREEGHVMLITRRGCCATGHRSRTDD